jgi:hypothetical protein
MNLLPNGKNAVHIFSIYSFDSEVRTENIEIVDVSLGTVSHHSPADTFQTYRYSTVETLTHRTGTMWVKVHAGNGSEALHLVIRRCERSE